MVRTLLLKALAAHYRYKNQFGEYIADVMTFQTFNSKKIEKFKTADGKTAERELYDFTKLNLQNGI